MKCECVDNICDWKTLNDDTAMVVKLRINYKNFSMNWSGY